MSRELVICLALALTTQVGTPLLIAQNPGHDTSALVSTTTVGTQAASTATSPGFQERYPRYQIVPGDAMDVAFEFSPEFNQAVTVQPDGYISLRGVGDVHVSSLTVPELVTKLQASYSQILNKPAISVTLKNFESPYFSALGQIGRPGRYVLHGETTLAEAVAIAGGFTDRSKHSHVILFRRVSSQQTEVTVIDMKKMMKAGSLSEDPILRPGDLIFVPQNKISKIGRFIPTSNVGTFIAPPL
jgi:polysaccharide export outer membrane protein